MPEEANVNPSGDANAGNPMGVETPPADGGATPTGSNTPPTGDQPGGSSEAPASQTNTNANNNVDPALKSLVDQFGGDPVKIAEAKRSTDQQYGKIRNESVQSFAGIVKANPDAIHQVPESLRDSVVKEVYGNLNINTYEDLQKTSEAGDPNKKDPFQEAQQQAFIKNAFTEFASKTGLIPDATANEEEMQDYANLFASLSETAVNLLASESPLLGDNKSLENAFKVAYFSTAAGQERLVQLGKMDGLRASLGKAGANLAVSTGKLSPQEIETARREKMLSKMGGGKKENPLNV